MLYIKMTKPKSPKQLTEDIERLEKIVLELGNQLTKHINCQLEEGAHKQ